MKKSINLFSTTFSVRIDDVSGNMEVKIIDLQYSVGLKENTKMLGSWIYIPNILTRTLSNNSFIHRENGFPFWNYVLMQTAFLKA
jgi:hypothetical protein